MKWAMPGKTRFSAGVALALVALLGQQVLFEQLLIAPAHLDIQRIGQRVKTLQGGVAAPRLRASATLERLDGILLRLGQQPATQTRIDQMHQMATQHGVLVRKASYQDKAQSGGILRHEIGLELSGSYPAIRAFLRALLLQDQASAVESLDFGSPGGSAGVRAQLRLVLFSRPEGPP